MKVNNLKFFLLSLLLTFLSLIPTLLFSQVDTAWVRRYNGPTNGNDSATALFVDNNGNVYVTGYSQGSGTYYDYATLKYDANGNLLWIRRYDGPGNGYDYATALFVDNNGNVYVTGYSQGSGTYYDYATIKYIQEQPGMSEGKIKREEKSGFYEAKKTYDVSGKLVKENKLKKVSIL
ncbi:MAG: SBBP repeat-containing protein [candidate division WOR-3 bacterium]